MVEEGYGPVEYLRSEEDVGDNDILRFMSDNLDLTLQKFLNAFKEDIIVFKNV